MRYAQQYLDADSALLVTALDQQIAVFESRGWNKAASIAEELVCQIYANCGVEVPAARLDAVTQLIDLDLQLQTLQ